MARKFGSNSPIVPIPGLAAALLGDCYVGTDGCGRMGLVRRRPMIVNPMIVTPMTVALRKLLTFTVFLLPVVALAQTSTPADTGHLKDWRARLNQQLQLMGHRNWIAVVDSAYPLQTSPGVETIATNDDQLEVVKMVLGQIAKAKHVRPVIFTDAELKLVPESDAKGVTAYREALSKLLSKTGSSKSGLSNTGPENPDAQSLPHEEIISKLDEAGKTFHILILKTSLTIPYTSVFIRLDCGYWSADAEKRLREAMASH
jgi:hypothetical protein